jgi:hypothetical protein
VLAWRFEAAWVLSMGESMSVCSVRGGEFNCEAMVWGGAFKGSAEWLVLLFLLWPSQSISLSGRRTLVLEGCLATLAFRLRMPVELVRGGMALGEAKGWFGDVAGMMEASAEMPEGVYTRRTPLPRYAALVFLG